MRDYIGTKTAAGLCGTTRRNIRMMCVMGRFPGAFKTGSRWKIPRSAHPKLTAGRGPANLADSEELRDLPARKRDDALRRLGIIQRFERFAAERCRGTRANKMAAGLFTAQQEGVTKRSLERWISRYKKEGLLGLVDSRGGGKFNGQIISDEAFEYFKSLYLDARQPTLTQCWQNLRFINESEQRGWTIPAMRAMYNYVRNRIPLGVLVLHREGLNAYEAKCAPYIQLDPDSVEPGDVWVGDHSPFNCWIRHRGKWVRPWITAWEDLGSRMLLGWHISACPNQSTILLAMKRACEKYGPPESVKIDNGRDYDSEMWTGTTKKKRKALEKGYLDEQMVAGIYAMMDVAVSFAIPYNAKAKRIERIFDTIDQQFAKTVPTYCHKDVIRRPEDMARMLNDPKVIANGYDLEGFANVFARYAKAYNNTAHSGEGMDGRTPAEVLASRTRQRIMAEGVLELLMRVWSGELTVGKNGVRFKKMYYGQYNMELAIYQGKKVRVSYDPDDLRTLYIYDSKTLRLVTTAEQNQLIKYGRAVDEDSLRFAMRQKSQRKRIERQYRDTALTANMDLTDLTIRAMAEGEKGRKGTEAEEHRGKTIRPVRTPLDDQVAEHKRREIVKAVKKAAGAESTKTVLDLDFSLLKPKNKYEGVRIFND